MLVVDLDGHEDEPLVRELSGSEGGALVGWENDGELAGCARLVREGGDVRVSALAVADSNLRPTVGAALLGALADIVNAERLVVDADPEDFEWLERCGFARDGVVDGRVRFARGLDTTPAPPERVAATSLADVEHAITAGWGRDTSADPDEWSEDNRARGQCDVTALLVRDLLGGDILIANVLRDGKRIERHAWNRLPSGLAVDLTRAQFRRGESFDEPAVQEPLAQTSTRERYELLASRVCDALNG